jgi:glucokinase
VGRAAAAGDPRARGLVESGGEALGLGIANLAQLLNPSRVALCGGVTGLGDLWLDAVRAAVERNVFPEVWAAMEIAPALLGSRSGAFGAAHLGELRDGARSS